MTENETQAAPPMEAIETAEYARVELMGHRQRVGQIQEIVRFGVPMLRINFWEDATQETVTEWYAGSALYCVSPVSKAVVDAFVERSKSYRQPAMRHLPAPEDDQDDDPDDCGADEHRDSRDPFAADKLERNPIHD